MASVVRAEGVGSRCDGLWTWPGQPLLETWLCAAHPQLGVWACAVLSQCVP